MAEAPHASVTELVELRVCPLLGKLNENAPGGLQLDCTEKDHTPAMPVSEESQLTRATTFQKYVCPVVTLTDRLVPV